MRITLNTDACEREGISIGALLYLLSLYLNGPISQESIKEVWRLGGILVHKTSSNGDILEVSLEKHGTEIVESFLEASMPESSEDTRYLNLASKLIELFPRGKKEGTSYMWRDSKAIIAKRLKALITKYKITSTDEDIINATKRYIESFNGDYRYMQLLKYFISKKVNVDGNIEESSQLMSYLENESQEENSEWTTNVL